MKKYLALALYLVFGLVRVFGQQIPKPGEAAPSYINLPVSLHYSEINKYITKEMKGVLYEDTSYTNNNNDNMTTRVVKNGDINMVGLTNGVQIELPLRIWFSKKIGVYYLNTDFDITLLLLSNVSVGPEWNIVSKSSLLSYKITRNPKIQVAGAGLDIKYIVQFSLDRSLPNIIRDIDKSFAQNDMLRKQAASAWQTVQTPVVTDTVYHTWVRVVPEALYMEPIKYYRDEFDISAAMEARIYTGIGKPRDVAIRPFRNVNIKDRLDNNFHIQVRIELPYEEMSVLATKMFADTTFSFSRKISFKVTGVKIAGNDSAITASIQTEGSINSVVTLTGVPSFSDSTQEFYLRDLDYSLESRQALLRVADRLFNEKLRRSFEHAMHYSLKDQIATARKTITSFLSDYKMYNKLMISGSLSQLRLAGMSTDTTMVSTLFDLQGQARVKLLSLTD